MAKAEKHSDNITGKLLDYLKGILTHEEKHAYEKAMMKDAFEEDAFEGLAGLSQTKLETDLLQLNSKIQQRVAPSQNKRGLFPILFTAAAVVIAIGTTIILVQRSLDNPQPQEQIAQNLETREIEKSKEKQLIQDSIQPKAIEKATKGDLPKSKREKEEAFTSVRAKSEVAEETAMEFESLEIRDEIMAKDIDEVVVVGYGAPKKAELSVTIDGVEEEDLASPMQAAESLRGEASGVEIKEIGSLNSRKSIGDVSPELNIMTYDEEVRDDSRVVRGVVLAANEGVPLPGVNVIRKGAAEGTITDLEGKFEISVPSEEESTLTFAYIGFQNEEVVIADDNEINLAMTEDVASLEEVVVLGYGRKKKRDAAGAVSTIRSEDLTHDPALAPEHIKPIPTNGNKKYRKYIEENINYDILPSFEKSVSVKLEFSVGPQGDISNIRVSESGGAAFDKEAIRLLKEGPGWLAGTMDGSPIQDEASFKFMFKPKK